MSFGENKGQVCRAHMAFAVASSVWLSEPRLSRTCSELHFQSHHLLPAPLRQPLALLSPVSGLSAARRPQPHASCKRRSQYKSAAEWPG